MKMKAAVKAASWKSVTIKAMTMKAETIKVYQEHDFGSVIMVAISCDIFP